MVPPNVSHSPHASEGSLPQRIGPYRVTGVLGSGGMGVVLSGYDDRLDRPVALKRIQLGGRDPERASKRFRREARVLARLSHQNVVQVHDWAEADGQDWLVMELVEGQTLDRLLDKQGTLPCAQVIHVACQIASGLAAAHAQGLVHRDLKLANVMVAAASDGSDPLRIKILDFGIAKRMTRPSDAEGANHPSSLTGDGNLLGSFSSMSPEQALGWPVDPRSDLFSLGTLLYQMLTGISPFRAEGSMQTLNRICSVREDSLSSLDPTIPASLADLVHRLLEKEPAHRPESALAVMNELQRLSETKAAREPCGKAQAFDEQMSETEPTWADGHRGADPLPDATTGHPLGTRRSFPGTRLFAAAGVALALVFALGTWSVNRLPTSAPLDAHQLYRRGLEHLERYDRSGKIDEAIADFQRALALDPESAPALAGLARAYWLDYFAGNLDPQRLVQARTAGELAIEKGEHLAAAHATLGLIQVDEGRYDEARSQLETALKLEPLNAEAHFGLARLHQAMGRQPEAEAEIQTIIDSGTVRWHHLATLGAVQFADSRFEDAESTFRWAIQLAPDNFLLLRSLGAVLYMQGEWNEAVTVLQQALTLEQDPTVLNNLGTIYFSQGLYAQAASVFEQAVRTEWGATYYLNWANLGDAYRFSPDRGEESVESFQLAVDLLNQELQTSPEDLTLLTRRLLYLAKLGDCDGALQDIRDLGTLEAAPAGAWYRLSVAQELCGQRTAAFRSLRRALAAGYALSDVKADPELLGLRRDVRFHPLITDPGEAEPG